MTTGGTIECRDAVRRKWEISYAKKVPFEYEYEIITASGQRKWVMEKGQSIFDERGALEALEGIIIDISDRKRQELQNKYLIEHDPVTGLYNRRYLKNLLENDALSKANVKRAILNINLRKIELLTRAYGFHYRQELLKKISTVFSSLCTSNCQLYSTYANRFSFYFTGYHDKNDLVQLCSNIKELLTPILLSEGIGVGVGILEIEDNDAEAKRILKNVLIASEHALSDTNQIYNCSFFDKEMESAILRQVKIKDLLRKIADGDDGNLYLQFQPILNLKSGSIFCFEALTRLRSEELGIISPLEFIPIAEETKLIVPIGKKIIYNALSFLKKLKAEGHDSVKISINVSAIQLLTTDFNSCLFEFLDKLGIAPTNLIIELTESIFAENYPEINKNLGELIATGINIAIDDFGTGYSSLAREQELNVNCLKIDKYFIDKLVCPNPKGAITSDIISMAHKFGHYVVAEGVENEVQKQYLLKHGCDMVQGYLISRPLDEKVALDFVRKQRIRNLQRYRESYGSVSKNLYR